MFLEGSNINQNEEQISDKIFMYYIDFRYSSVKSGGCNGRAVKGQRLQRISETVQDREKQLLRLRKHLLHLRLQ